MSEEGEDEPARPIHEHPDETRRRLYEYHKRAGTLALYYYMYPLDAPKGWPPDPNRPRGRGGR